MNSNSTPPIAVASRAKRERDASRTRWTGLSASESRGLGRKLFPEAFTTALFDGRSAEPGLKIVQYRSQHIAIAQTSSGQRLLVQSSAPLRAAAANGDMAPVDLDLRERTNTFSTTNSNVGLRIAKNPAEGTELLGSDITVALDTDTKSEGTQLDGRVFTHDVATDTDYVVSPLPDGGEFSWLIRSGDAPERFVLDLDIPDGATIRRARAEHPIPGDPPHSLEIVKDDEIVAYVKAPRAYDADHAPVDSSLHVLDDNRVAMTVEHHGRDLRYPLYADPEVVVPNDAARGWQGWRNWYSHGSNSSVNNYYAPNNQYYNVNYYGSALFQSGSANNPYNPNGLYLSIPTHTYYQASGTGINWGYAAPAGTYIYRTTMGGIGNVPFPTWYSSGYRWSYIYSGIVNGAGNTWEAGQSWLSNQGTGAQGIFGPYGDSNGNLNLDHCFETRCDRTKGSDGNQAVFGLGWWNRYNTNTIYTGEDKASATLNWASVYLGDRNNPTMDASAQQPSRDWYNDTANTSHPLAGITANDAGLGVYGITLSGAAAGNQTLRPTCSGQPNSGAGYCPKTWTTTGFSYQLKEGINDLYLTPTDIVDHTGTPVTWTEKIDRTPPQVTPSGDLYVDASTKTIESGSLLHVHAVDGDPATATSQRSGVKTISVKIDGGVISNQQLDQSCTRPDASCLGDLDFVFDVFDYAPGQHTVSVSATDQAGNISPEQSWTINVGAGDPNDKVASIDQGTDGAVLDQADDQSTACATDPDAGPDGQYCNPDDAGNDQDSTEYARAAATSGSTAALAKDGPGWGIADQNSLASTQRTVGTSSYANMFVDPLFIATHVKTVRRVVPWDIATRGSTPRSQTMGYGTCRSGTTVLINGDKTQDVNGDGQINEDTEKSDLDRLKDWMTAAKTAGEQVLISFEHTRDSAAYCYLPTRPQYRAAVRAVRDTFPYVSLYTSWNEPNHPTQPSNARFDKDHGKANQATSDAFLGMRQAGRFWTDLKKECQRKDLTAGLVKCTVAAGEFLDTPDMSDKPYGKTTGNQEWQNYLNGLNGQEPSVWAWHTYSGAYNGYTRGGQPNELKQVRKIARLARYVDATDYVSKAAPAIWITETGGRYDLHRLKDYGNEDTPTAAASANADLDYILGMPFLAPTHSRITRLLVYSWLGAPGADAPSPSKKDGLFDSGLLDVNNNRVPRAMYSTFKQKVSTAP